MHIQVAVELVSADHSPSHDLLAHWGRDSAGPQRVPRLSAVAIVGVCLYHFGGVGGREST